VRELIITLQRQNEQVIDTVTQDQVLEAGFSEAARERARKIVGTFEQFIQEHKDEITALQILYNRPTKAPLTFETSRPWLMRCTRRTCWTRARCGRPTRRWTRAR
jgi:type I restriction enzyme R subunit